MNAAGLRGGGLRRTLLHVPALPHSTHALLAGAIVMGVAFGVLARALLLRVDDAHFPSRPHGRINYLFLGLVAAVLGALAPAALLTANYTGGVFLAIGLSQFHQVRQIERAMLKALDQSALVPRGRPYIEGLSMMLETRNYLAMLTAMLATTGATVFGFLGGSAIGLGVGLAVTALARTGASVDRVASIAAVPVTEEPGCIRVGGLALLLDPPAPVRQALPQAIGLRLSPRGPAARLSLAEPGQRQAILHNLSANLGLRRVALEDRAGDPAHDRALLPRATLDAGSGDLAVLLFPQVLAPAQAVGICRATPLLETVRHRHVGRVPAQGDSA